VTRCEDLRAPVLKAFEVDRETTITWIQSSHLLTAAYQFETIVSAEMQAPICWQSKSGRGEKSVQIER
jgi:hypothetical protein